MSGARAAAGGGRAATVQGGGARGGWRSAPAARVARLAALVAVAVAGACSGSDRPQGELRFRTDDYAVRVSSEPTPPRARSRTLYRVVITHRESGRPMEKAEGQVYASNGQGANIYDALEPGPELGTYYATLRFITAGEWALNLRFRGAPGDTIERVATDGWRQIVGAPLQ